MDKIPLDTVCRHCGKRIIFVPGKLRPFPVESKLTPFYRTRIDRMNTDVLFTSKGGRINCRILPEENAQEAEGYAHKPHLCSALPRRGRPESDREARREDYRQFRRELNARE